MKTILFIRHAQSTFNEVYQETENYCPKDPWLIDAPLSNLGHLQSTQKQYLVRDFDTIICSPLTRCLQTTINLFRLTETDQVITAPDPIPHQPQPRVIVHPLCREYQENSCDVGTRLTKLTNRFQENSHVLDFDHVKDEIWWFVSEGKLGWTLEEKEDTLSMEPWEMFEQRVKDFLLYLSQLKAERIAVIAHGVFIRECTGVLLDNCESIEWKLQSDMSSDLKN